MIHNLSLREQFAPLAGRWIALNREQSRVIATGDSFDEVRLAAASKGQQSVLVGQLPADASWIRRGRRYIHLFAVFIAVSQPLVPPNTSGAAAHATTATSDSEAISDPKCSDAMEREG